MFFILPFPDFISSCSRNNSLGRDVTPPNASIMSATSSVSSLSMDSSSSGNKHTYQITNPSKQSSNSHYKSTSQLSSTTSTSNGGGGANTTVNNQQLPLHLQNSPHKNPSPDFYIIRVTYETDNVELDGIVLYKSIMLGNNERTPQVIKNAMLKLGLDGDPDRYTLAQVLPDKELVMPPNANVYYAVNTAYNLNFILRNKSDAT